MITHPSVCMLQTIATIVFRCSHQVATMSDHLAGLVMDWVNFISHIVFMYTTTTSILQIMETIVSWCLQSLDCLSPHLMYIEKQGGPQGIRIVICMCC